MNTIKTRKLPYFVLFLLIFSYFFSDCFIDVGFALKPYMVVSILSYLFLSISNNQKKIHFDKFDFIYVLFIIYIVFTSFLASDIVSSFRFILGIILVFVLYLLNKESLTKFSREDFEKSLTNIAIIFGIISIIYYFLGLIAFNFRFVGNDINKFGVTIDRQMPRLISLASDDPNISCCFFALPFCLFLDKHNTKKEKIGLIVYLILMLLTLSRGGLLALIITFVYYILFCSKKGVLNNIIKILKSLLLVIISFVIINFVINKLFDFSIINLITSRVNAMSSDGGSGRVKLWYYALNAFLTHPLIGIGINNTLIYNISNYNRVNYTHNTYLEVLSELGIIGFVIYSIFLILVFKMGTKYKTKNAFPICFFIFILVSNLFLSMLIDELFYLSIIIISMYHRYYMESLK